MPSSRCLPQRRARLFPFMLYEGYVRQSSTSQQRLLTYLTLTMPSDRCTEHTVGLFSPSLPNDGRVLQPGEEHVLRLNNMSL